VLTINDQFGEFLMTKLGISVDQTVHFYLTKDTYFYQVWGWRADEKSASMGDRRRSRGTRNLWRGANDSTGLCRTDGGRVSGCHPDPDHQLRGRCPQSSELLGRPAAGLVGDRVDPRQRPSAPMRVPAAHRKVRSHHESVGAHLRGRTAADEGHPPVWDRTPCVETHFRDLGSGQPTLAPIDDLGDRNQTHGLMTGGTWVRDVG